MVFQCLSWVIISQLPKTGRLSCDKDVYLGKIVEFKNEFLAVYMIRVTSKNRNRLLCASG